MDADTNTTAAQLGRIEGKLDGIAPELRAAIDRNTAALDRHATSCDAQSHVVARVAGWLERREKEAEAALAAETQARAEASVASAEAKEEKAKAVAAWWHRLGEVASSKWLERLIWLALAGGGIGGMRLYNANDGVDSARRDGANVEEAAPAEATPVHTDAPDMGPEP